MNMSEAQISVQNENFIKLLGEGYPGGDEALRYDLQLLDVELPFTIVDQAAHDAFVIEMQGFKGDVPQKLLQMYKGLAGFCENKIRAGMEPNQVFDLTKELPMWPFNPYSGYHGIVVRTLHKSWVYGEVYYKWYMPAYM